MDIIRITTDADGVVTVWFDAPGKSVNSITDKLVTELTEAIALVEKQQPPAKALIFASAKKDSFIAGGDLFEIRAMSADPDRMTKFLADGQALYTRIANLPFPTIVAINGDCLGGGFELALACTYRVAADDGSINIGLPETKIGILPGWGGTVRMPQLIGIRKALPLILLGKPLPPKKAKKTGLIDETVRPEALLAAAKRIALKGLARKRKLPLTDRVLQSALLRKKVLAKAEAEMLKQTHGNYPAAAQVIQIVRDTFDHGNQAGFDSERRALRELMHSPACHNLMRLFFLRQGGKRAIAQQVKAKPKEVNEAAVIGGGTMGAGIAYSLARAGVRVRLIEVDAKAAAAALGRVRKMFEDDTYAGRLNALEARHALNRVSPCTDWTGLGLADLVVEAVAETMDVKREVFAKLDRLTRPDCVLATNTSSLSVAEMAASTSHPNRVVGLHFFNPVPKMPLVEVVRAPLSDDQSLATAVGASLKMGKTPVLVKDAPGFLVNRVLIPYLAEALYMAGEGIPVETIDLAMKRWGMPMGPLELMDEIGLDIGSHVLKSLGSKLNPPLEAPPTVGEALKRGWLGKKSGTGFYVHGGKKGKDPVLNHELAALVAGGKAAPQVSEADIQWRLVLPMVNEAAKLLGEGVTDSADTVDLATVFGTGFAPFRGGLARFADAVGPEELVKRLNDLATRHGPRFVPAEPLRWLAAERMPFASLKPVESGRAEVAHSVQTSQWRDPVSASAQGSAAPGN
jgi:3-hydroxyacyl-CoA dehydrogenase/enoyl-CoA hydratase/3-hydroxybutyryl-CoA epimerase